MKIFYGSEEAAKEISIDNRLMIVALYIALNKKGVITEDEFESEYELQQKLAKGYLERMPTSTDDEETRQAKLDELDNKGWMTRIATYDRFDPMHINPFEA